MIRKLSVSKDQVLLVKALFNTNIDEIDGYFWEYSRTCCDRGLAGTEAEAVQAQAAAMRAFAHSILAEADELTTKAGPLADWPEGIVAAAKAWRERAEAAEAALRWTCAGDALPAPGQCVLVLNPLSGKVPYKDQPRYVERWYSHKYNIWLDIKAASVPPPSHWLAMPPGPSK